MNSPGNWFCNNPRCQHHVYVTHPGDQLNYDVPTGYDKLSRRTIGRQLVVNPRTGAERYFCDTCMGVFIEMGLE